MNLPRLRWLILGMLFVSTAINYIDRQALSVLLPTLRTELNLSSADYGLITTGFLVAYTIGQIGFGVLIDKIGTRLGFAISITIWSLAAIAHAFVGGAASLAILRFLLGIGEAGNYPAGGKVVAQWLPPTRRAFGMGIFDGGSAAGAIIAPPLVAFLALQYGWRTAFIATGVLGFVWLALWLWIYAAPDEHRWLSDAEKQQIIDESGNAKNAKLGFGEAVRLIIGARQLWGLMATRFLATPVWWFYVFWLPDYLGKERGFTLQEIGFFGWIPFVTVDLGKLAGGFLSDKLLERGNSPTFARKIVMAGGALLMAAGVLVIGANSSAETIAWVSVATFGFGMWSANVLALHTDIFPTETMATVIGLTTMAASLGGAISTYIIGQIVDRAGYAPVFYIVGSIALVALFVLIFGVGTIRKIQPPEVTNDSV